MAQQHAGHRHSAAARSFGQRTAHVRVSASVEEELGHGGGGGGAQGTGRVDVEAEP
jgi:hypothetical protein